MIMHSIIRAGASTASSTALAPRSGWPRRRTTQVRQLRQQVTTAIRLSTAVNLVALSLHKILNGDQDNAGNGDDDRRDNGELDGRCAAILFRPGVAQPGEVNA